MRVFFYLSWSGMYTKFKARPSVPDDVEADHHRKWVPLGPSGQGRTQNRLPARKARTRFEQAKQAAIQRMRRS